MGEPALPIFRSADEFLAWEERQEERCEFVGGVVTMMAGGTENHDLVGINAARLLGNLLQGTPCRVHGSNLKVRSPAGAVMYPNTFVRCGPARGERTVVEDARLVVEILSPRTEQADLTRKRWAYQAMPTMQAILFVAADEVRVELATREPDGSWRSRFYTDLDAVLPLDALDVVLPLAEIYAGAELGMNQG